MRKIILTGLFAITLFLISAIAADAATLTCQQVGDVSISVPQFSSKQIELRCTASGGTVNNLVIAPNANPGTGLTMASSQTMPSSISQGSSGTAKWTITGDSPNTYSVSYTISSDSTNAWTGASTTTVRVPAPAKLTVEYVLPPAIFTPAVEAINFKINNIGGTTANNVRIQLSKAGWEGPLHNYPTSIAAGASSSYAWTNETGFNESGTYTTKVFIGDVLQDSDSITVNTASANQTQYAGWNLISLGRVPEDRSVSSIFSDIAADLTIVWAYNATDNSDHWKMYDPNVPA